jgi:hypothetical protein
MKKLTTISLALLIGVLTLIACKKTIENPGGGNNPPVDTTVLRKFQLVIDSLPGETITVTNLAAIISVTDGQDELVVSDRKVSLSYNGKYVTDSITLAKGQYKVTKLWLIEPNNTVRFVTPITGSAKAPLVTKPLPLSFSLQLQPVKQVSAEVARVNASDVAENFGYPAGSFGNINPPVDPNGLLKIRVQPIIRIGDIVYDSIPVTLNVLTWSNTGQLNTVNYTLHPGTNEIWLSKAATKYQLKITKWGTFDEMTLQRSQVQEGGLYSLGGNTAAKKLSEVLTYKLINNNYVPETRAVYTYELGKVKEILHYRKRPDGSNYLAEKEIFQYTNGKVNSIKKYSEGIILIETTNFTYRNDGKLHKMVHLKGNHQTQATVAYTPLPSGTGISGNHMIDILYNYNYLPYITYYNMSIQGGTMLQSITSTSHGNNELAHYQYDYSINPFVHINLPDLYLSNYSKHNKVAEQRTYHGDYPIDEPYKFSYSYGSDGYPSELITKYKTYLTGQHTTTIKTVYKY